MIGIRIPNKEFVQIDEGQLAGFKESLEQQIAAVTPSGGFTGPRADIQLVIPSIPTMTIVVTSMEASAILTQLVAALDPPLPRS